MALSCGSACIKYLLFAFNLLCALLSIAIIVVGALLLANIGDLVISDGSNVEVFPIVLIVVGVASFLISFFGCCGAIRESQCLLYTYSTFLMILLIAHIVLGVLILVQMDEMLRLLRNELQNLWNNRQQETAFWDVIQRSFQCCGLDSPDQWGSSLPASCCPGNNNVQCTNANVFTKGCSLVTNDNLSFYGEILAYVAIGAAVVQLVGFIFSCILVNSVRRNNHGHV